MLEKRIVFQLEHEECTFEPISPSEPLVKTAANYSPEIKQFIAENIKSDPKHLYILVSALGAGEIWGPNVNGDFFKKEDVIKSHKTFETMGFAFTHHQNKDPNKSAGRILLSHWNPRMQRVELIVMLERDKAPRIAADIDRGKMWDVSMGCRVKFDVCSVCGNKAHKRSEYCVHLKKHMGEILPDGRQVYAINPNPRFFDISFVWIGADKTAKVLSKVASEREMEKQSDMYKEIPGQALSGDAVSVAAVLMDEFGSMKKFEKRIPSQILEELATYSLPDILMSALSLGMVFEPDEFTEIIYHKGEPKSSMDLAGGQIIDEIVEGLIPFLEERSAYKPYLLPRMIKLAYGQKKKKKIFDSRWISLPAAIIVHNLYGAYLDHLPDMNARGMDKIFKEKPYLLPLLTSGLIGTSWALGARDKTNRFDMTPQSMEKLAADLGGRILVGVPAAYLLSNIAKRWEDDNRFAEFLARRPGLVAMLGVAATNTSDDWAALKKALSSFDKTGRSDFGYGFGKHSSAVIAPAKSHSEVVSDYSFFKKHASTKSISELPDRTEIWQTPEAAAMAVATFVGLNKN